MKFFKKLSLPLQSWIFPSVLAVSYLLIQQRENSSNYRTFTKPYPCNIDSFKTTGFGPRLVTYESKMRPETFKTETETRKNGLKTSSV